jgi:hypothetical protein
MSNGWRGQNHVQVEACCTYRILECKPGCRADVTDFRIDENAGLHKIGEFSTLRAATTAGVGIQLLAGTTSGRLTNGAYRRAAEALGSWVLRRSHGMSGSI